MPFFDPHRNPYEQLKSVQESYLLYSDPNIQFALKIELDIKERIKAEIRAWRNTPTKFNTDISDRLGMILTDLEDRKCNGLQLESSANYLRTISDVCLDNEIFGFPLHFSFTNIEEIIDRIYMIAIHEAKHPQVEFAFAVKVFPYASNLNSVWVFLCTVVSTKSN
jgi:coiled-coil and C2 domain-containing protein 2A